MSDWCIENDLAAQREMSDTLEYVITNLRADNRRYREEYIELRDAMEWEMGSDWLDRVLEQYKNSLIKTEI